MAIRALSNFSILAAIVLIVSMLLIGLVRATESERGDTNETQHAETDRAFDCLLKQVAFKFERFREPTPLEPVPRINRNTPHSVAVLDLEAGLITITLPDAGRRS